MSMLSIIELSASLVAGFALGGLYFLTLLRAVRLQTAGATLLAVAPLYAVRFIAAGCAFWLLARLGAAPLLLALSGFVLARLAVQRRLAGVP